MKRILLSALCIFIGFNSIQAQGTESTSVSQSTNQVLTLKDTTYLELMSHIAKLIQPRFKMYKTENTYNLIKLDTATGALWQVQYGMNSTSKRMEYKIDDTSLLYKWETPRPGRFELYPTNNMSTFILLDTERGWTYQVQWHVNSDQRFRIAIY